MKKQMDKLKGTIAINKKIVLFLIGISLIGIVFGAFYMVILQDSDKTLVQNYMTEFMQKITEHKVGGLSSYINASLSTTFFTLAIWVLGISVIGVPIMLFMYFAKTFVLGFSLASFIYTLKLKGCLVGFLYFFPHTIINFILYILLLNYAITLSLKLIDSFFLKKTIDFKLILKKYVVILGICIIGCLIMNIYESFILPNILSFIMGAIK